MGTGGRQIPHPSVSQLLTPTRPRRNTPTSPTDPPSLEPPICGYYAPIVHWTGGISTPLSPSTSVSDRDRRQGPSSQYWSSTPSPPVDPIPPDRPTHTPRDPTVSQSSSVLRPRPRCPSRCPGHGRVGPTWTDGTTRWTDLTDPNTTWGR